MPSDPDGNGRRVLISGAGVAGLTAASWLTRWGFETVVAERGAAPRVGRTGHAVDLFGPALQVLDWMGLGTAVREARTQADILSVVRPGHPAVEVPDDLITEGISPDHVEILRGDLVRILSESVQDSVEVLWGDALTSLATEGAEVQARFASGATRTFDLVVGADGLHSATRRSVFGEETSFLKPLGGWFAVFSAPNFLHLPGRSIVLAEVNRVVEVYPTPGTDRLRVLLLFRADEDAARPEDTAAQRRFVAQVYAGARWEVPTLLDHLANADDFYLDPIAQIRMEHWTTERVALVGDAGYATGPAVGGGTSLAVIGAYTLASALTQAGTDTAAGMAAYETAIRPVVEAGMTIGPRALALLVPRSRTHAWALPQAVRLLPLLAAPVRRRATSIGGGPHTMFERARMVHPDAVSSP